jgi:hypothetical protein
MGQLIMHVEEGRKGDHVLHEGQTYRLSGKSVAKDTAGHWFARPVDKEK